MGVINVLPQDIANKIAAGEVVERPASVVKELVENSIDANSTSITVEIKNGGISYIRVTDNGTGMSFDDAVTAFSRHATSKISNADDLFNIGTLGFRGEALASIAAVANVTLITKKAGLDGTLVEINAGEVLKHETSGCPDGTTITIHNLFANVPARMKFLKKSYTEAGYVTDVVQKMILSHPSITFKLIIDGKEKLFSNGSDDLKNSIYNVYGREYSDNLISVFRDDGKIKIEGFVGNANISRSNRSYQNLFVNNRYVINRNIAYRIEQAYETTLMQHKFPFFVLNVTINPMFIDVNVHPTKQEIKFADEQQVGSAFYWAVKDALTKNADTIREEIKKNISYKVPVKAESEPKKQQTFVDYTPEIVHSSNDNMTFRSPVASINYDEIFTQKSRVKNYKIIGQLFDTYILIEFADKIVLIDQHAAHERLIYEKLVNEDRMCLSQLLLSPVVLTFLPKEFNDIMDYKDEFFKIGFDFEDFGSNSLLLRSTPDGIDSASAKDFILECAEKFSKGDFDTMDKDKMHSIACKAALKGNSKLSDEEIETLIDELIETGGINSCPHGRPIMQSFTKYDMEKLFKRIQ
ncbi:MAG: DNA mismatch repair endonuclease MutL [Clostridia bacterium]|nr:DNA mismatch repair endonuclease MutL [Clostridia bacterium]